MILTLEDEDHEQMSTKIVAGATTLLISFHLGCPAWTANSGSTPDTQAILQRVQSDLEKNVRPSQEALSQLEGVLEREPNNYKAHLELGVCYDSLGLPVQAVEQFETAMKLGPNDPRAIVELIRLREKTGSVDTAASLLKIARQKFPDNLDVIALMGREYMKKNQIEAAEGAFAEVLASKKDIPGVRSDVAELRLRQGRLKEAYELATQEIAAHPNNSKAYLYQGSALLSMGKTAQAMEPLRKALEADQKNAGLADAVAKGCYWSGQYELGLEPTVLWLALTAQAYYENPQTQKILVETIRHCPKKMVRDYVNEKTPRYQEALRNAAFHVRLGDALDQTGFHDLALAQYRIAVQLDPRYADASFKLARSLELYAGDYDYAKIYYTKARSLQPDNAEINNYLERLELRMPNRSKDLAWHLKDMFRGVFFNYDIPQKQQ